jgi:RHS repeat-associated protein
MAGLIWLLGDHLGSTAITASADGTLQSELRFKPWGEPRFISGVTLTDRRYTGQRAEGTGLVDYGARFYDPSLGRWISPDALIPDPGNSLDFDRYQYVRGNPLKYVDPSGHMQACADGDEGGGCGNGANIEEIQKTFDKEHGGRYDGLFAEYYATRHQLSLAKARNDPYLSAYEGATETARYLALARIPQKDFKPSPFIDPISAYRFADAVVSLGKDIIAYTSFAFVPNPGGMDGNPDHQSAVATLKQLAKSEFSRQDVRYETNSSIKRILTLDRRPDVSVWSGDRLLKVYEAARVDMSGNFVPREQRKMYEYFEMGIPYYFLSVK